MTLPSKGRPPGFVVRTDAVLGEWPRWEPGLPQPVTRKRIDALAGKEEGPWREDGSGVVGLAGLQGDLDFSGWGKLLDGSGDLLAVFLDQLPQGLFKIALHHKRVAICDNNPHQGGQFTVFGLQVDRLNVEKSLANR